MKRPGQPNAKPNAAARALRPVHPQQQRIPLVLKAEDVTVSSVGQRYRRDEVAHTLIVSLAEPVDLDDLPTV